MRNKGKAADAARAMILRSLRWLVAILFVGFLATLVGRFIGAASAALVVLWVLFAASTWFFFRDPDPQVPTEPGVIVSPGHGTVDVIGETEEKDFMGGRCRRVSIFLSVFNVHVQNAPVAGRVALMKYRQGSFRNAMQPDSAHTNENLLIGFESRERSGKRIAFRLIAGLIARRIVPFVEVGDELARGDRASLIQFGSRVDLYLPLDATVVARIGDKVQGGVTVLAKM